jgi:hypothetical protein
MRNIPHQIRNIPQVMRNVIDLLKQRRVGAGVRATA